MKVVEALSAAAPLRQRQAATPESIVASLLKRVLARLLEAQNRSSRPPLTEAGILAWADAYRRRTEAWPSQSSGVIPDTRENWNAIDQALRNGNRGLPGGFSLSKLLGKSREVK